jgi:hypothetical protein
MSQWIINISNFYYYYSLLVVQGGLIVTFPYMLTLYVGTSLSLIPLPPCLKQLQRVSPFYFMEVYEYINHIHLSFTLPLPQAPVPSEDLFLQYCLNMIQFKNISLHAAWRMDQKMEKVIIELCFGRNFMNGGSRHPQTWALVPFYTMPPSCHPSTLRRTSSQELLKDVQTYIPLSVIITFQTF